MNLMDQFRYYGEHSCKISLNMGLFHDFFLILSDNTVDHRNLYSYSLFIRTCPIIYSPTIPVILSK